ncbi:hypothetical protein FN846DRAFT_323442 [Sphaerosporella brunnea]|uniref:Uncharacterized protein n=1 Tax=Sphaerosporella brunnea TaxID=1250544 RepID=A0A5J5F6Q1_9PEZI|nr:hypothetical protein FN846DRAFT_323442 [Sphaerosporella brunnea]
MRSSISIPWGTFFSGSIILEVQFVAQMSLCFTVPLVNSLLYIYVFFQIGGSVSWGFGRCLVVPSGWAHNDLLIGSSRALETRLYAGSAFQQQRLVKKSKEMYIADETATIALCGPGGGVGVHLEWIFSPGAHRNIVLYHSVWIVRDM